MDPTTVPKMPCFHKFLEGLPGVHVGGLRVDVAAWFRVLGRSYVDRSSPSTKHPRALSADARVRST